MRLALACGLAVFIAGCASVDKPVEVGIQDPSPLEDPQGGENSRVWATNYYVHVAPYDQNGSPLRSSDGHELARLASKDWCAAAIEGTAIIRKGASQVTLNYASLGRDEAVDCLPFVPAQYREKSWAKALGRTRWIRTSAPYGLGTAGYQLVPYRTVAVDPNSFPIGTVLFIPQAKGVSYPGPGGTELHDGYFFAADVGGAIKGNHIDVFTGTGPNKAFGFIKSRATGTFDIVVVDDPAVKERLARLHRPTK